MKCNWINTNHSYKIQTPSLVILQIWIAFMVQTSLFFCDRILADVNLQKNSSMLLQKLFANYDAIISPHADLDIPTEVEVGIYIMGFSSVSEVTMDYKVTLMLRQSWTDPRLQYDNISSRPFISMPGHSATKIWVPDLIFVNEKQGSLHQVTMENRLLRIYRNGTILYSQRLSLVLSCSMKLHRFPFDEQKCLMEMESFAYTTDTLTFVWKQDTPLDMVDNLELPQFHLTSSNMLDCNKEYYTGAYPCLKVEFQLRRDRGFHFIQSYVPTALIVLISWISFWVSLEATAARISLGVTTVLTMVTMNTGFRNSLPPVSYIKSIDIWLSACLLFVFCSLLEFAFVNSVHRQATKRKKNPNIIEMSSNSNAPVASKEDISLPKVDPLQRARAIDKCSRLAFPAAFFIFNVIYWITALIDM